jgi:hypothetical protein
MLKKLMIIGATSGLMMTTALAQQTTPSDTPAATPPKADSAMPKASGSAQFISSQSADQWVASKFKGTDVLGPNNEKVGDVTDLLFDKNGKILAYVVGVGGFLGIGQKDVALEPTSFQTVPYNTGSSASTSSGGTSSTSSTSSASSSTMASSDNDPNHVKLKISMTKDELKNAPAFEYWKSAARTTSAPATGTTGSAPRPAPANR